MSLLLTIWWCEISVDEDTEKKGKKKEKSEVEKKRRAT